MNISGKAGGDQLVDRARAERLMRAINDRADFFGAAVADWSDTEIAYLTEQLQRLTAALDQAREDVRENPHENPREKATDIRESGVKALS